MRARTVFKVTMTVFFAGLALDIAVPAVVLSCLYGVSLVVLAVGDDLVGAAAGQGRAA